MKCVTCFVLQSQFTITYEKKKAASQFDTLTPEQSQQADKEAKATSWVETVGGMNRGRLYGTGDMSSHFSRGAYEGYYYSHIPASLSTGGSMTSSDAVLQHVRSELEKEK